MAPRSSPLLKDNAIARNRWFVHIALIIAFLGATLSPIFLSKKYLGHSGTTNHAIIGVLVLALVMVHLLQRRHTVGRMFSRLMGHRSSTGHHSRQSLSDLVLWILTLNAMVSGFVDFVDGRTILLPIPGPFIFQKWHLMSVLVLLIYVIVHVVRRRKRLRLSHIR